MRKIICWLLCLWFLVPFVLMTDVYPFFRFGMFAEPLKPQQKTEMLQLWWKNAEGTPFLFQPAVIGLSENHWGYVLRHYFYTNKSLQLFSQIHQSTKKKLKQKAVIWQIRRSDGIVLKNYKVVESLTEISHSPPKTNKPFTINISKPNW